MPAYNASNTIDACLASLLAQRTDLELEIMSWTTAAPAASTSVKARRWQARFARLRMSLRVIRQPSNGGAARANGGNRASVLRLDRDLRRGRHEPAAARRGVTTSGRNATGREEHALRLAIFTTPAATPRRATRGMGQLIIFRTAVPRDSASARSSSRRGSSTATCGEARATTMIMEKACDDLRFFLRHVGRGGFITSRRGGPRRLYAV